MVTSQAKSVRRDDIVGELLEKGQALQQLKPQPNKPKLAPPPSPPPPKPKPIQPLPGADSGGLAWLEPGAGNRQLHQTAEEAKQKALAEQKQKEQIEKMAELDKRQSTEMYNQIMAEIKKWEQIRKQEKLAGTAKYITGKPGFDEEQVKDPESFWDKMKKKKEEEAKKLPWSSKQGMGTGEITRGVSG